MKKFIIGLVCGIMLASTFAFAATYISEPATFKVLVNGEEFVSDPPVLVIEGSTYLPLRAMGDALGVPVEWNGELRQVEVGTKQEEAHNTADGYKLYEGSNSIIDFGEFCGVKPCIEPRETENVTEYIYKQDELPEGKLAEYIEIMKATGYTFSIKEEKLMMTTMYAINKDSQKDPFIFALGNAFENSLDWHVIIVVPKN